MTSFTIVPSLSSLVASESENIAAVEFKWSLDYDGGHEITGFSIEYSVVNSDPPESKTFHYLSSHVCRSVCVMYVHLQ